MSTADIFVTNSHLKSLGKFELLKTVERLQSIEALGNRSATADMSSAGNGQDVQNTVSKVLLTVSNLGTNVKLNDLVDFFGLDKTPFLKSHCGIVLAETDTGNDATLTLPEYVADEVLKLSGAEFFGKSISIKRTEHGTPPPSSERNADSETPSFSGAVSNGEKVQWMEYVEIDTTYYHIPYTLPNKAMVVYAIRCTFGEDEDRRTREPERGNPGVWRIESKNL